MRNSTEQIKYFVYQQRGTYSKALSLSAVYLYRYVKIVIPNRQEFLELCEVQVYKGIRFMFVSSDLYFHNNQKTFTTQWQLIINLREMYYILTFL